jgi:AraC family transcriptional regulator
LINYRIVERPAFEVVGKKSWIPGQGDNESFGRFWAECQREGLLDLFKRLSGHRPGAQTGGVTLGVSRVEQDPANRAFYYMIAIEKPEGCILRAEDGLESYTVPATTWAVFECHGKLPEAIVTSEMFAFGQWLPASGYVHALAPEMEVYPPLDGYCEFWLPIRKKEQA